MLKLHFLNLFLLKCNIVINIKYLAYIQQLRYHSVCNLRDPNIHKHTKIEQLKSKIVNKSLFLNVRLHRKTLTTFLYTSISAALNWVFLTKLCKHLRFQACDCAFLLVVGEKQIWKWKYICVAIQSSKQIFHMIMNPQNHWWIYLCNITFISTFSDQIFNRRDQKIS